MPGRSASATWSRSAGEASTAYGAQATPARANAAFSAARSWQIATASAPGATGRLRARVASASAGTFSNSVVSAAEISASRARPAASR